MSASIELIHEQINELDKLISEAQSKNDQQTVENLTKQKKSLMTSLTEMNKTRTNKLLTDSSVNLTSSTKSLLQG